MRDERPPSPSRRRTGTGAPPEQVQEALARGGTPPSPDAIRQLDDAFAPARTRLRRQPAEEDYDDVVQQSFPASDPPPPPG